VYHAIGTEVELTSSSSGERVISASAAYGRSVAILFVIWSFFVSIRRSGDRIYLLVMLDMTLMESSYFVV
jgi:hypothetical protein